MLRIRDVYPGSRIRIFSIPDPLPRIKYFNPKKLFLSSRKYNSGSSSRIRILFFLPIPDPGFRDQKGTGSRIRNTAKNLIKQTNKAKKYGVKEYFTSVFADTTTIKLSFTHVRLQLQNVGIIYACIELKLALTLYANKIINTYVGF